MPYREVILLVTDISVTNLGCANTDIMDVTNDSTFFGGSVLCSNGDVIINDRRDLSLLSFRLWRRKSTNATEVIKSNPNVPDTDEIMIIKVVESLLLGKALLGVVVVRVVLLVARAIDAVEYADVLALVTSSVVVTETIFDDCVDKGI